MSRTSNSAAHRLTESAIMLAFAAVLSIIKIVDMPYGGSVTAFSMLPLILLSYRYGVRWGLVSAAAYGMIQMLLGLDNLSYATGFSAVVMILLFDYIVAFMVLGLAGVFRRPNLPQGVALALASVVTGALRYLCHTLTGCTVWAGLSVPTAEAAIYSLSYNATYMIPEIIILVFGSVYLSRFLSFEGSTVTRATRRQVGVASLVCSIVAKAVLLIAAVGMVILVAPTLQNEDGGLFLQGVTTAPWGTIGIVAACGIGGWLLLEAVARALNRKEQ